MDIKLRQWRREDAERLAQMANNPEVEKFLRDGFPSPYSYDDALEFISMALASDPDRVWFFAVVENDRPVGSISCTFGTNVYRCSAEIGYFIGREFCGRGIATAAVKLISEKAFERPEIVRLTAEPFSHNSASRKVLEKAGYECEAILRRNTVKHGAIYNTAIYRLLKD